jgi:intein/homing endonuclease
MGLCGSWVSSYGGADLCAPCSSIYDLDDELMEAKLLEASEILFQLSGQQFTGSCTDTVRPCSSAQWTDWFGVYGTADRFMAGFAGWDSPFGLLRACGCRSGHACSCRFMSSIQLLDFTTSIEQVKIGADIVPPTSYELRANDLVRTDGLQWTCFPAGTLVLTETGQKPIETIQAGERVLTHRGRWRKVLRAEETGESETVEVKGHGGQVRCTPDHLFLSSEVFLQENRDKQHQRAKLGHPEWVPATQLVGATWATPRQIDALPITLPEGWKTESLPSNFWWVIGRWVGDGWTSSAPNGDYRIVICAGHHEADDLESELCATGWKWRREPDRTATKFRLQNRELRDWLRSQFGVGAAGKRIPAWLLGTSEDIRQSFLAGLLSADGWKGQDKRSPRKQFALTTVSHELAIGVRMLLAQAGYGAAISRSRQTTTHIEGRKVNGQDRYQVRWVDSFAGEPYTKAWKDDEYIWSRIHKVTLDEKEVPVFDLEVEEDHSFIAEGLAVHNCCTDDMLITFTHGVAPPAIGVTAAKVLGCELYLACDPSGKEKCRLPRNISSIARQGVSVLFRSLTSSGTKFRFGLAEVDFFLEAYAPYGSRSRSIILSPDVDESLERVT